jgi:hypothetical protein
VHSVAIAAVPDQGVATTNSTVRAKTVIHVFCAVPAMYITYCTDRAKPLTLRGPAQLTITTSSDHRHYFGAGQAHMVAGANLSRCITVILKSARRRR